MSGGDEHYKEKYNREGGWKGCWGCQEGLTEKVTLSQKPEGSEGSLVEQCSRQREEHVQRP